MLMQYTEGIISPSPMLWFFNCSSRCSTYGVNHGFPICSLFASHMPAVIIGLICLP